MSGVARAQHGGRLAWRGFRSGLADPMSGISHEYSTATAVFQGDIPVEGRYVLSTDSGLCRLERDVITRISALRAFGIAIAGNEIYVATMDGPAKRGIILVGDHSALDEPGKEFRWRQLYSVRITDAGERIHQISLAGDALWLANTANNAYTKIDRHTGRWLAEICPFRCELGQRIKNGHNHVNAVSAHDSYLLFGAWRTNMQGCLGLVGDGILQLYNYRNAGIHDCHIVGKDIVFTDSFRFDRAEKLGPNGCVIHNGQILDENYFNNNEVGCVRGVAGQGREMIAGLSFPGSRTNRFSGTGGLLLFRDWSVVHRIAFPYAQVYDLIRDDGSSFDRPPAARNFSEAAMLLRSSFGPPVIERTLEESLMPRDRNVSLNGAKESSVDEYLA